MSKKTPAQPAKEVPYYLTAPPWRFSAEVAFQSLTQACTPNLAHHLPRAYPGENKFLFFVGHVL